MARVLLVEDNLGDVILTKRSIAKSKIPIVLDVVRDGEQALDFLFQRGAYVDAVRPDVVLLDLNLPKYNGSDVLTRVKANPELRLIPIIMLTSSDAESDIVRSYAAHCQSFLLKPLDPLKFYDWWFKHGKIPRG